MKILISIMLIVLFLLVFTTNNESIDVQIDKFEDEIILPNNDYEPNDVEVKMNHLGYFGKSIEAFLNDITRILNDFFQGLIGSNA